VAFVILILAILVHFLLSVAKNCIRLNLFYIIINTYIYIYKHVRVYVYEITKILFACVIIYIQCQRSIIIEQKKNRRKIKRGKAFYSFGVKGKLARIYALDQHRYECKSINLALARAFISRLIRENS
jgi:hypothetical protein